MTRQNCSTILDTGTPFQFRFDKISQARRPIRLPQRVLPTVRYWTIGSYLANKYAVPKANNNPPRAPSTVFFGETRGKQFRSAQQTSCDVGERITYPNQQENSNDQKFDEIVIRIGNHSQKYTTASNVKKVQ